MPLIVTFMTAGNIGSVNNLVGGKGRLTESVALGGTSTGTAESGEFAMLFNTETDPIQVAHGTTPNSGATAGTLATSSYYIIGASEGWPVEVSPNDKFAAQAIT